MDRQYKMPLCLRVKFELMNEFALKVGAEEDCKVVKVIELLTCKMIEYWIECPVEKDEKITEWAFMTWIKNPKFQKYYSDSENFKKIAEAYLIETQTK